MLPLLYLTTACTQCNRRGSIVHRSDLNRSTDELHCQVLHQRIIIHGPLTGLEVPRYKVRLGAFSYKRLQLIQSIHTSCEDVVVLEIPYETVDLLYSICRGLVCIPPAL